MSSIEKTARKYRFSNN